MISRRSLFGGALALIAAPSIVRASILMPISTAAQFWDFGAASALYNHPRSRLILPPVVDDGRRMFNVGYAPGTEPPHIREMLRRADPDVIRRIKAWHEAGLAA